MLQLVAYLQLSQTSHLYAVHLVITYSDQYIVTLYCIKMEVCESYNARSNNSKIRLQVEITVPGRDLNWTPRMDSVFELDTLLILTKLPTKSHQISYKYSSRDTDM